LVDSIDERSQEEISLSMSLRWIKWPNQKIGQYLLPSLDTKRSKYIKTSESVLGWSFDNVVLLHLASQIRRIASVSRMILALGMTLQLRGVKIDFAEIAGAVSLSLIVKVWR